MKTLKEIAEWMAPRAKAAAAAAAALIAGVLASKDGGITAGEWVDIIAAVAAAAGITYAVPNRPSTPPDA